MCTQSQAQTQTWQIKLSDDFMEKAWYNREDVNVVKLEYEGNMGLIDKAINPVELVRSLVMTNEDVETAVIFGNTAFATDEVITKKTFNNTNEVKDYIMRKIQENKHIFVCDEHECHMIIVK